MIRIRPIIAWYDFWIGAYWDRNKRPVPMLGVAIAFHRKEANHV